MNPRSTLAFLCVAMGVVTSSLMQAGPAWSAGTSTGSSPAAASAPILRPLTIQTVPAIPHAEFILDGRALVTGADGIVRTTTTKAQRDGLATNRAAHLSIASSTIAIRPGVRAQFAGWYDGGYHYDRTNRSGQLLRAAFDFDYLTSFSFVRPNGSRVVPAGFAGMQLHATAGATVVIPKNAAVWLPGIKVASTAGHLGVNDVEYKISSVKLRGNNVVHVDQQRFVPAHQQTVTVQLLLFTVTLDTHDAFFGFALGSAVDLKFADGTTQHAPIRHGSVTFTDLPRGDYALKVHAPGLSSDKALSVSRNQVVKLQVISWIDVVVILLVFLTIAGALVFIGRSRRRGRVESAEHIGNRVITLDDPVLERSARAT
jgi:hypothetical protein